MYEVEIKVPATLATVRDRLEALGAGKRGAVVQIDTYYDAPHRSFAETDEALRIREERLQAEAVDDSTSSADGEERDTRLTYKGPLIDVGSKTREEHETGLEDGPAMRSALEALGFEPAATVRKARERYGFEGFTITLDLVDGVGEFVEIEAETASESEIETLRTEAGSVLERLHLDVAEQVRTSYLELTLSE